MDNDINEIQDELERLLQEINRIRVNNRNTNTRNRRQPVNSDILAFLRELLVSYNTNIVSYQENMRFMLQIIYLLLNNQTDSPTPRTNRTYGRNNLFDFIYYFPELQRTRLPRVPTTTPITSFMDNIIISPSAEQIQTATTNYEYSREIAQHNTNCPITLEEFQDGEQVTRINHCGHIFRRDAIQNWFQRNVRCPVCRYDIRENVTSQNQSEGPIDVSQNNGLTENEIFTNVRNQLSNSILNILNEYNIPLDISQNLLYTFEFPIVYNDMSYNSMGR